MKKVITVLTLLAACTPLVFVFASRYVPRGQVLLPLEPGVLELPTKPAPRIIIDAPIHDFGMLDPLQTRTHAFLICNDGGAPLELTPGSPTCKCTLSDISSPVIQPGESGEVKVTWNTGRKNMVYAHSATIHTNDPRRRSVDLRIRGTVRRQIAAAPADLVLGGIEPDCPESVATCIYSQVWDAFTIEHINCSMEGLTWDIDPIDVSAVPDLQAKSAYRLTVTMPTGMPEGFFQNALDVCVLPDGGSSETLPISVSGKVLRRLAVYGPGVESTGAVDLGMVPAGKGLHRRLLIKVRDEEPQLRITGIEAMPEFLDVRVTPYQTRSQATGLYHLDLEIPETAPLCGFRGTDPGKIRLVIDHPRIGDLVLQAQFAVTDGS